MLVIYVIGAVIASVLYTVIKVIISEWIEEPDMSRLSSKRKQNDLSEVATCSGTMKYSQSNIIEISDDDSMESSEFVEESPERMAESPERMAESPEHVKEYPAHEQKSSMLSIPNDVPPVCDTNISGKKKKWVRRQRKHPTKNTIVLDSERNVVEYPAMSLPAGNKMKKGNTVNPMKNCFGTLKRYNNSKDTHRYNPLASIWSEEKHEKKSLFSWNKPPTQNLSANSNTDSSDRIKSQWKTLKADLGARETNKKGNNPTKHDTDKIINMKQSMASAEVMLHHNITIAGVNVILPVKPYSCQIAVMNMLINGCTKQQNCLLESPTGSGKTLALLCGVLAWQEHYSEEVERERVKVRSEQLGMYQNYASSGEEKLSDGNASYSGADSTWIYDEKADTFVMSDGKVLDNFDDPGKMAHLRTPKIYYGTRTHKQIEQVVRELGKTSYRFKRMTILSSREHTCIQDTKRNKTELCNELLDPTKFRGCRFYTEFKRKDLGSYEALNKYGIEASWDIEDLVSVGKQLGVCPYFAARDLMANAEIIFCPYNYLIDPDIRESMQITLKNEVIILDEAHNIEDICRDVGSVTFRYDHLRMSALECEKLRKKRTHDCDTYTIIMSFFRQLMTFLREQTLKTITDSKDIASSECWNGQELVQLFNMHGIDQKSYSTFLVAGKAAILDYNKAKEDVRSVHRGGPLPVISQTTKRTLEHLTFALQMLTSATFVNDYRACVTEATVNDILFVDDNAWIAVNENTQRVRTLKLICMNPAVIFAPVALSARSIILASGTLTPTSSFQSELGTEFAHTLSANHVIPKDQVYVRCIPRGPTGALLKANYQNVNSWSFQDELGKLLLEVCRSVPHGVLCFFSSYHVMHTQIQRWKQGSCWYEIEKVKRVFLEPRYTNQLADTMKEYRDTITETSDGPLGGVTGALLFAVFRGKVAEGIDFSDNEARCVLAIGIPYAVRLDPTVDMKFKYNDMNASKGLLKGNVWYTVQAFRALNQALGRCVRHKNDWGAVLLVDERFLMKINVSYLPKWIKSMWIESKQYNLGKELQEFTARQRRRENKSTSTA